MTAPIPLELTPSQSFLVFILARAEDFYRIANEPNPSANRVDMAVCSLIAFVPSNDSRASLYAKYFDNRKTMNNKTAALIAVGATISVLAESMGVTSTSSGGFV